MKPNHTFYVQCYWHEKSFSVWGNVAKCGAAGKATINYIMWHTRIACWITKAIKVHLQYLILIAFPRRQLRERTPVLRYTYTASFFTSKMCSYSVVPRIMGYTCTWRSVFVYELYLWRQRDKTSKSLRYPCTSNLLLAFRLGVPPAQN